ncbi:hypothetical protein [Kushneria indalinina]|uniref:DNA polymerase V n=1 Tax=Kushneria indalinina DSM 14324 TaxID=1122140 RepID=A0A3D9DVW7_9GAMM|nr:hypothetical protein [Kushneria indalinina]REC94897.1 hypothetical protein C8D72_1726 [Kushneria indalinina DSM 14324]
MHAQYLGPVDARPDPSLMFIDLSRYPASCYLMRAGDDAGVGGPVFEGDVLVVDEARHPSHGDLAVIMIDGVREVFQTLRVGPQFRFQPVGGGASRRIKPDLVLGVVVSLVRRCAA